MTITAVVGQAGGLSGDSQASVTRAFPGSVTSGNLIVIAAGKDSGGSDFASGDVTKSAGTATISAVTLSPAAIAFDLGGGVGVRRAGIWYATVTGSGSLTLQIAGASGTYWHFGTGEFNSDVGWNLAGIQTNSGTNATDSGTSASSGNATTTANALFVGVITSEGSGTTAFTPDGAFTTIFEQEDASSHLIGSSIFRAVNTGGITDAAEWTIGSSNFGYASVVAAFPETGGGVGATGRGRLVGGKLVGGNLLVRML